MCSSTRGTWTFSRAWRRSCSRRTDALFCIRRRFTRRDAPTDSRRLRAGSGRPCRSGSRRRGAHLPHRGGHTIGLGLSLDAADSKRLSDNTGFAASVTEARCYCGEPMIRRPPTSMSGGPMGRPRHRPPPPGGPAPGRSLDVGHGLHRGRGRTGVGDVAHLQHPLGGGCLCLPPRPHR